MKRRSFLKTAALSALGVAALSPFARSQDAKKKIPMALQIYSVRELARQDLPGTLRKIAEIGYVGVELIAFRGEDGLYGNDVKDIRKLLDDLNVKCCGYNLSINYLRGDEFDKTVELLKALGAKAMIVASLNAKVLATLDGNKKYAEEFNRIAERAKAVDMQIGYHPHKSDATLLDGVTAWERFFDSTTPDVIMQMDVGNYMSGGGNPYKMIEKFKGRTKLLHVKETGGNIVGEGEVDWNRVFELCETVGGTEWYIVENGRQPTSFEIPEKDFAALKKMGKV